MSAWKFTVAANRRLPKGECGLTRIASGGGLRATQAIDQILSLLPEDAVSVRHDGPSTVITIDQDKLAAWQESKP